MPSSLFGKIRLRVLDKALALHTQPTTSDLLHRRVS